MERGRKQGDGGCPRSFPPTPDSTKKAVVSSATQYRAIDRDTPRGVKMILINRSAGVAVMSALGSDASFFTHWAPLPTFEK